ncbi:MAG: GDP-mannose 4,6-dehydratase [Ardenticatenaceae bacterium]
MSKRYLLAVDFQTIAHLAGYRTTKVIKRGDIFEVGVIVRRKKYGYVQNVYKHNDGHDEVWCVQTLNGTIVTRDRDCISISGNCNAMYLMLQASEPDDFVIASGETHTIRRFCELAFNHAGLNWEDHVVADPAFYRPAEVDLLVGDASKAGEKLGWEPTVSFEELVQMMVDADIALLESGERLPDLSEATAIRVKR